MIAGGKFRLGASRIVALTARAAYAASRISSNLRGTTKQF
jgi:hypothetical protein